MLLESVQMFPIFLSNKKCRLEHVVNKLTSCLITEFLWILSYKLHGILSNSMHTLWHSMGLHRHFREPHGIPWTSTIFHEIPWTSINTSWNSMAFHGTLWIIHGTAWHSMEVPWNSMDFHRFPWNSMDFHKFPWISVEVFHTGQGRDLGNRASPVNRAHMKRPLTIKTSENENTFILLYSLSRSFSKVHHESSNNVSLSCR